MTWINAEKDGAIILLLKQNAAITALIGSGDNCRAWPDNAKEGAALPYCVILDDEGDESNMHLTGASGQRITRVDVECYASSKSGARALADKVRLKCLGFRGLVGTIFINWIKGGLIEQQEQMKAEGTDESRYCMRVRLDVMHKEPVS